MGAGRLVLSSYYVVGDYYGTAVRGDVYPKFLLRTMAVMLDENRTICNHEKTFFLAVCHSVYIYG